MGIKVLSPIGIVFFILLGCAHQPQVSIFINKNQTIPFPIVVFEPTIKCGILNNTTTIKDHIVARQMADLASKGLAIRSFGKAFQSFNDASKYLIKISTLADKNGKLSSKPEIEWSLSFLAKLSQLPKKIKEILNKQSMEPKQPSIVLGTVVLCEGTSFTGSLNWHLEMVLVDVLQQKVLWHYQLPFSSTANETGSTEQIIIYTHKAMIHLLKYIPITQ